VDSRAELESAFAQLGNVPCLLEGFLPLEREVSVVLGRNAADQIAFFPVAENQHKNGILDISIVPARIPEALADRARDMAAHLARELDYVGVMAVEFFVLQDNSIVFNEMAPRPHNSGHYTLDATACDQFQQQVRALCGLPLGDTRLLSPVVMVNLLGDEWTPRRPGKPCCAIRACTCISTASPKPGPAARWAITTAWRPLSRQPWNSPGPPGPRIKVPP
jgi:5-(carboxyamino)imidazole ribonucleotide synthase